MSLDGRMICEQWALIIIPRNLKIVVGLEGDKNALHILDMPPELGDAMTSAEDGSIHIHIQRRLHTVLLRHNTTIHRALGRLICKSPTGLPSTNDQPNERQTPGRLGR